MANHYHKVATSAAVVSADQMQAEIERFIRSSSRPALLEPGDKPIPLLPGEYTFEIRTGKLSVSAWPEAHSLTRRIIRIAGRKPGAIECTIQRFGGATGKLLLLDLDHPRTSGKLLQGSRRSFAEAFRRMLSRQFPGWKMQSLSSEPSLTHSFSPKYPRALLERANQRMAAIACPLPEDEYEFLSFALLWHHHTCGADRRNHSAVKLILFLPESAGNVTALRLKWLSVAARLFRFNDHGNAGEIDAADLGNMETRVVGAGITAVKLSHEPLLARLRERYNVEATPNADGSLSLRTYGLPFATIRETGIESCLAGNGEGVCSPCLESEVEALAAHLEQIRNPASEYRDHPLFRAAPERRLESVVRRDIAVIDPGLAASPLWSQVVTFAAADRDVIDLLGATSAGRVTVLELKIGEDIHLPLQALDYWMRVDWHTRNGDLDRFFAGLPLTRQSPRLLLVAPGMQFHASNEVILTYFLPAIETERVGLNLEWQQGLKVVFRLNGFEQPQSHRRWL